MMRKTFKLLLFVTSQKVGAGGVLGGLRPPKTPPFPHFIEMILLFFTFCFFLTGCEYADTETNKKLEDNISQESLKLIIEMDRDTYQIGQIISANLRIDNLSDENILIHTRFTSEGDYLPPELRDIYFKITKPSGNAAIFSVYCFISGKPGSFKDIEPNSDIGFSIKNLQTDYALNETGEYTIKAFYENVYDPKDGREAWKGLLESNIAKFRIVQ